MASGPWDNVQLPGPPNGPAWYNAAANMMNATQGSINNAFNAYQQGQNFQYQQQQRDFFKDPDNQALFKKALQTGSLEDYAALQQKLVPVIGAQGAEGILQQFMGLKSDQDFSNALRPGGSGQTPPTSGPATSPAAASPENIHGKFTQPQSNPGNLSAAQTNDLAKLADANGIDLNGFLTRYPRFQSLLDEDLTTSQKAMATAAMLKFNGWVSAPNRGGTNPVSQSGGGDQEAARAAGGNEIPSRMGEGSPAMTPRQGPERRIAQAASAPSGDRSGELRPSPLGTLADAQRLRDQGNEILARGAIAARRSPAAKELAEKAAQPLFDRAKQIDESIGKYNEPATNPDVKASLEQFGEAGKSAGKRIGETIEAGGKAARDTINTLDVMETSLRRSAGNFSTGPGAGEALKFKEAVNNIIPGFFAPTAVVDAEAITKLNAALASTAAKQLTSRPSQLEFKAFMANNPGLSTSPGGSLFLIDILRQEQRQSIKLGQLALDKKNWDNWGSTEQAFYDNPKNKINIPKKLEQFGPVPGGPAPEQRRSRWTPEGLQPIR